MVTGIDLVKTQFRLAAGRTLADLGLEQRGVPRPSGFAVQLRINMESMTADGHARATGGTLAAFEPPTGPGVRVDTFGYAGYTTSTNFDSLLAKLIVHSASENYSDAIAKAYRSLCEFRIEGVTTNQPFLQNLLRDPDVIENRVDTGWVERHAARWSVAGPVHPRLYFERAGSAAPDGSTATSIVSVGPANTVPIVAPMQGLVIAIDVREGDTVLPGQPVGVLESMKMEHVVVAEVGGVIRMVATGKGGTILEGQAFAYVEPVDSAAAVSAQAEIVDPDAIRADLRESRERHALGLDEQRPEALARRRKTGQRTARENLAALIDPDSFIEYGALAVAAQRSRRTLDDLIRNTPADGLVAGVGTINANRFDASRARCMVLAYDYTVLAGTQGALNHKKKDRMIRLAEQWRLPIVLFAEGGGGRPGDTDIPGVAGLDGYAFYGFARLSGLVPLVGVVSGRCFAGNAALLGCCDVIIATRNASIGMGGPAMIEGGGLGRVAPDDVGPVGFQAPNGVIDVLVDDEPQAVSAARQYLSYFQGAVRDFECADQKRLRNLIPENRVRAYDIRKVIETLADRASVLELRPAFGVGIVTALIRIEGRPLGLFANNPKHLGGAIDSAAADKVARFMQLCDAFDLPMLSLCDTPGFMVGPESERTASVRHVSRMFVTAANLSVPFFSIVLRKGYGLGAQAMTAGSFHAPFFNIAWPSGEFGPMGLEGAVRLGYRKELDAVADPAERQALFEQMVAASYERGKALNMASYLEIDDVIDPMDSRRWILRGLDSVPPVAARQSKKRPFIDTW
jgi:acetyl-CoA carboxylase carboxyltransferase component/biotin carboxyl carrier protein